MTMGEWMDAYTAQATAKAFAEGRIKGLLDILADFGAIPEEFQARLQNIDDETLKLWTKLAARADSMDDFLRQI